MEVQEFIDTLNEINQCIKSTSKFPDYLKETSIFTPASFLDDGFIEIALKNPEGLSQDSEHTLSDKSELTVFSHPDFDEEPLSVIKNSQGDLRFITNMFGSPEEAHAFCYAQKPEDFSFCFRSEHGNEDQFTIVIMPTWCAKDISTNRQHPTFDASIFEMEPIWSTSWFLDFHDKYLCTEMESIWSPKNADEANFQSIYDFMTAEGMKYSTSLEKYWFRDKDYGNSSGSKPAKTWSQFQTSQKTQSHKAPKPSNNSGSENNTAACKKLLAAHFPGTQEKDWKRTRKYKNEAGETCRDFLHPQYSNIVMVEHEGQLRIVKPTNFKLKP